jgi:hypothetical protein
MRRFPPAFNPSGSGWHAPCCVSYKLSSGLAALTPKANHQAIRSPTEYAGSSISYCLSQLDVMLSASTVYPSSESSEVLLVCSAPHMFLNCNNIMRSASRRTLACCLCNNCSIQLHTRLANTLGHGSVGASTVRDLGGEFLSTTGSFLRQFLPYLTLP